MLAAQVASVQQKEGFRVVSALVAGAIGVKTPSSLEGLRVVRVESVVGVRRTGWVVSSKLSTCARINTVRIAKVEPKTFSREPNVRAPAEGPVPTSLAQKLLAGGVRLSRARCLLEG